MRSVSRTSKSLLVCLVATIALLASNHAHGQGTGGTVVSGAGGVTGSASPLTASDFTYYLEQTKDGKNWVQLNTTDQQYFLNRARCECATDTTNFTGSFKFVIVPAATTSQKITTLLANNPIAGVGEGRIYAGGGGQNCLDNPTAGYNLAGYCTNLLDPTQFSAGILGGMAYFEGPPRWESTPIPVAWLVNSSSAPVCSGIDACNSTNNCSSFSGAITIYFWARTTANNYADVNTLIYPVNVVGKVPYTPTGITLEGGNEALTVKWSWPLGQKPAADSNFKGVQLFCQRGENTPVFPKDTFAAYYQTAAKLCGSAAPTSSSYGGFSELDTRYLCSGLIPSTSTSYRITGLQNGINYGVGAVAVDKYGNVSPISEIKYEQPVPTVDFYTYYKDDAHGSAQGGFCTLASQRTRPSVAALLCLVGLGLILHLRRRSKRRPPGAGTLVLLVAAGTLSAGPAQAQPLYHDSSFVQDSASEAWEGSAREFAIEARFGLYTPNVDSAFSGKGAKPQADIFGSKRRPMWQLEFDWEFLKEFGTLALGGVIGYYKENAEACTLAGLKQDPPICERSGDNTSLRLIPLAALLIYRLDEGASHWHIPLVPYAKIGLNYTIWTVTNGNGDVAWSGGSKGQGGTMGWQAAVGLSLQLDFIDPGASREFDADSGVNHTYAFFELAHIDASGLYRKDALRVGDNTWFAGLMFEF